MVKMGIVRRLTAIVANLSLLLNSFLPFFLAIQPVYAQSPEGDVPTEVVVVTETPETTNNEIVEVVPTQEVQPTPASTEIPTPTSEPTTTPEVTPTDPTPTPSVELDPSPTPTNSEIGTLSPDVQTSPTPEVTPITENTESNETTPTPEQENPEPVNTESTEVPTPTDVPVLGVVAPPVFEKICLTDEQTRDTTNEEWTINDESQISETNGNVQLGVRYVYPQDNKVSVIFKCLPKDETLRTPLKIQKIKTSELDIPNTSEMGEYAYDITTGMNNGDFSYDLTLPKPENSTAEISYIEKTLDQALQNVDFFDLKKIEESKIEQQTDVVKAVSVDHFTIYIVTTPSSNAPKLSTATINNQNQVTVLPGETITVTLKATTSGNGSNDNWNSSQYKIGSGNWNCVNTDNHNGDGTYTESFSITAPNTPGTYDLSLNVYNGDNCSGGSDSDYPTIANAITVVSNSVSNPTLPQACGLDIALVIDNSTSIDSSELVQMKNAMKAFTTALNGTPTQFSVTRFATTATINRTFTSNITDVNSAIDNISVGGGYTNWQDGLTKA